MKQYEAVILALEKIGGIATLGQLNQEVMKIKECNWNTKTPFASIRRIVQLNKEIYKIKPGLYALTKYKNKFEKNGIIAETETNKDAKEIVEFNHSYYQGIIVLTGNLKGLHTHIPNQDKNKNFIDKKLKDIQNLNEIPNFSYENIVSRSSTIDVTWFNKRKMPHSFFEIEHSTDIQNSLLKYNDLQDFYSRMIIVADEKRKKEYESKIKYSAFDEIQNRVKFLSYQELIKQYESLVEQQNFETII